MAVMSSEWSERLEHWIRTLGEDFLEPVDSISWEASLSCEQLTSEEADKLPYTPVTPGFTWGEAFQYCWFRGEICLPERAEGERIVLDLHPGGESTLFVDGEAFGTYRASWVIEKHHYMVDNVLTVKGEKGRRYRLLMETYAGHFYPNVPGIWAATGPVLPGSQQDTAVEGARRRLGESSFCIWKEEAYQLFMDVMTLKELMGNLEESSLRAVQIAEALERFTLTVDFEQDREGRSTDYRLARAQLQPLLNSSCGATAPCFYAIGNAHIDLAWLWPAAETTRKSARTFAQQLRLIKDYPGYRFLQSQPALYEMCRKQYPEVFHKIKGAVQAGQWIAEGAMWVEPDTNLPGGESLIRQLLYGKRYFKEMFGVDSRLLWLPDSFGYSAALPQILKSCGIKYLVTQKIFWSYNEEDRFPYHYFNWKGLDGSEVTSFLPTSYTYRTSPGEVNGVWKKRTQLRNLDSFLLPFGYGDGGGGPTRDHVEYALRQEALEGGARIRMESPTVFFEEMAAKGGPQNTYVGELYFSAHRGTYTSQAAIKNLNRRCELMLRELELWSALSRYSEREEGGYGNSVEAGVEVSCGGSTEAGVESRCSGYEESCGDDIESLWKRVLFQQFHDILPGSSIERVNKEAEAELTTVLREGQALIARITEGMLSEENGLTFWNSLAWNRRALVTLPASYAGGARTPEGEVIPVEVQGENVKAMLHLPPCGHISLLPFVTEETPTDRAYAASTQDGFIMENSRVRILVNHMGEVISFINKESGRELAAGRMNQFLLYKDVPRKFDAWDIDSNYRCQQTPGAQAVSVIVCQKEGLEAVLRVEGTIGQSEYVQWLRLEADSLTLGFDTRINWQELHRLWKTSFPVAVYSETALNEIQFGYVSRPTHRSRPEDSKQFEVCNHRYSAICDGTHGAAVLNDSKYGISMNANALELTLLRASASPQMRADNGKHRFSYAFTAWEGSFQDCDVVKQGYE